MIRYGRPDAHAHVLVADDDPVFADTFQPLLACEGFRLTVVPDGPTAFARFLEDPPDLVVLDLLDVVAPGMSGLDLCRALRHQSQVPIVILSQRDTEADRVLGLEMGADDYVTKACGGHELVARLRAALRRGAQRAPSSDLLGDGGVELDPERHEVRVHGRPVDLSVKEFRLLHLLLLHKGKVVPRRQLVAELSDYGYVTGASKSLETHVRRLRAKLEADPNTPRRIVSVRGVGYKFEVEAEASEGVRTWSSRTSSRSPSALPAPATATVGVTL
jgi:two-component system response regulator RegX3